MEDRKFKLRRETEAVTAVGIVALPPGTDVEVDHEIVLSQEDASGRPYYFHEVRLWAITSGGHPVACTIPGRADRLRHEAD